MHSMPRSTVEVTLKYIAAEISNSICILLQLLVVACSTMIKSILTLTFMVHIVSAMAQDGKHIISIIPNYPHGNFVNRSPMVDVFFSVYD